MCFHPPPKNRYSKSETVFMLCMVIDFCKKLHFFGTVTFKHGIIYNQNVGAVLRIQRKYCVFDNSGCKDCCETNPVNLNHLHEAIHSNLCKSRSVPSCNRVHVHASVRKNQQKQILEYFRYWNPFLFVGVGCLQG